MTIATKNGAIIVKDGKLAENCECCGGWYCVVTDGGACCEDGAAGSPPTCSIRPSCDCEGTGKVFKGVGTTCTPNPCCITCDQCPSPMCIPRYVVVQISGTIPGEVQFLPNAFFRFPSISFSETITLSGYYSSLYRCGFYQGSVENSASFNRLYVQLIPGAPSYAEIIQKFSFDPNQSGIKDAVYDFTPIVGNNLGAWSRTIIMSGASALSNGSSASGYCYNSGGTSYTYAREKVIESPLSLVHVSSEVASLVVQSSYGSGIPNVS